MRKVQNFLVFSLVFFAAFPVFAKPPHMMVRPGDDPDIVMPYDGGKSIIIDIDKTPPFEPNLTVVKFLQNSPPQNIADRVDRLVHGITIDIPPEIDIYGYEIRRYMQAVGNPRIYTDNKFLREQFVNLKKANVILGFWRQYLKTELQELEVLVEKPEVSLATRTAYKQNSVAVRNFLSVSNAWIDSNTKLIQYLDSMEGHYEFSYPDITFKVPEQAGKFLKLLTKRQQTIKELRSYSIFRLMVY